ncbi:MAG: NAD(P)H-dependent oxidoreductase subunit E, partial [Candidatus Izemoplasmatales bacterium]|nr:NAD(P)H-dependent oxidoreductase subunit E [Candidatus Izemoplasmatales bacterium]
MLERMHILICGGTGCMSSHSKDIRSEFDTMLAKYEMSEETKVVMTGCFGLCEKGPVVVVYPDEVFYSHVSVEDVEEIVKEHVVKGRVVERLLVKDPIDKKRIKNMSELKFYSKQKRIALRNCGNINPLEINEYIAKDGYLALGKVLTEMTPAQVIEEMKKSGLRGRGGGGFSTGMKWEFAAKSVDPQKYVICNADEGDPGAFMDR